MKLYDIIAWDDPSAQSNDIVVYKHEAEDFNTHAQLIVHQNQVAVFFQNGQSLHAYGPGRHTLTTSNLPFVKKLVNVPTGGESPFHCEVFFINLIRMTDLGWGLRNPASFRLSLSGMDDFVTVKVGACGTFGAHIDGIEGAKKLLELLTGTQALYTKRDVEQVLKSKLIERVTNLLGETINKQKADVYNLASYYTELSDAMLEQMRPFFATYGIMVDLFSFEAIELDAQSMADVREYDKRRRESILKRKEMEDESIALAAKRAREGYTYASERGYDVMQSAASNEGMAGTIMGAGMGLGMGAGVGGAFGLGMANVANNAMNQMGQAATQTSTCPKCGSPVNQGAKFCGSCGSPMGAVCPKCGAPIAQGAKFCGSCGSPIASQGATCIHCGAPIAQGAKFCSSCGKPQSAVCPKCGAELQPGVKFCSSCGSQI